MEELTLSITLITICSFQASNIFDNLGPGSITISVIDQNSCTNQITAIINEPSLITGSVSTTDASCYDACDGTATATVVGGTAPYSQSYLEITLIFMCWTI